MTDQTRRATRLIRVQQLLQQHGGLTVAELAAHLNYSRRTVQRDLGALQSDLGVPLVNVGRRWRIMEGSQHPLSPVHLTLQESRVIFLAMQAYATATDERDDNAISALEKLGDTLPAPLQDDVRRTMETMRSRPEAEVYNLILRFVTRAWAESARLRIWYRSASSDHVEVTNLDPYLLRPGANGGSIYVVGWSSRHDMPRVFKIDRIVNAELTSEHFEPRNLDEIVERLGRSWGGVVFGDEQYDVTVDFTPQAAGRVRETTWHVTQQLEELPGGGVRLRCVLPSLLEFVPWVLGWGAGATVVGPDELREQIAATLHAAASNYPQPIHS